MAKKVKLTTTINVENKASLDKMAEALGKPANQIIDHMIETYYRKTWPRHLKNHLAARKRELEYILRLQQEIV